MEDTPRPDGEGGAPGDGECATGARLRDDPWTPQADAAFGAAADGIAVHGLAGELVRVNRAAEELVPAVMGGRERTGDERFALEGATDANGFAIAPASLPLRRALAGETVRGALVRIGSGPASPARWLRVSSAPLLTAAGDVGGAVSTFADVTRERELQERLEDLLRAVSHDLRTPLSAVQLHAAMLKRNGDVASRADTILQICGRMNGMIQDLVDAARLESGLLRLRPHAVEASEVIADIVNDLRASERERVVLHEEPRLGPVRADRLRLHRILANLVENALKYSPRSAKVEISTRRAGTRAVFAVHDRGPGIAPAALERIFTRFYRAEPGAAAGSGLGLFISRRLAEVQGGTVWVESGVGSGSTFQVELPLWSGAPPAGEPGPR
jgi:signal transduction histidine kinase